MPNHADILAALATLTPDQLAEVQARASFLSGGRATTSTRKILVDGTQAVQEAHFILEQVLKEHHLTAPPYAACQRLPYHGKFKESVPVLWEWVEKIGPKPTRTESMRRARLLWWCVGAWLTEYTQAPMCHRTMCQSLARLPDIMDQMFPGYAASGLLHVIGRMKETDLSLAPKNE